MISINSIKNKVRTFQKEDAIIVYVQDRHKSGRLYEWQHRLRMRTILRGCLFHTYHQDMDFSLALSSGWTEISS